MLTWTVYFSTSSIDSMPGYYNVLVWKKGEKLTHTQKREPTSSQFTVNDVRSPAQPLNRLCYQRKVISGGFFLWIQYLYRLYKWRLMWRVVDFIVPQNKRFLLFRVRQKDAARKSAFFCIRYFSKTKSSPAKKTTEQCFTGKTKPTWQNSAIFQHFQK